MAFGLILELVGLAIDARLHGHDPTLVQRESLGSLRNPGHLIFAVGLGVMVGGVAWWGWQKIDHRRSGRRNTLLLVVVLMLSTGATSGIPDVGAHPRVDAPGMHPGSVALGHGGTIHSGSEIPISWTRIHEIDAMLTQTKAATEKYRDVRVALAEGYLQEGPSLAGAGAHFVNRALIDRGAFDHLHPSVLLYERQSDWTLQLVGVAWFLPKQPGDQTPPAAMAPLAVWHHHTYPKPGICVGPHGTTNLVGEACTADGGRFWAESPWMLHAWLYRDSPNGVFSLENPAVRGVTIDPDFAR